MGLYPNQSRFATAIPRPAIKKVGDVNAIYSGGIEVVKEVAEQVMALPAPRTLMLGFLNADYADPEGDPFAFQNRWVPLAASHYTYDREPSGARPDIGCPVPLSPKGITGDQINTVGEYVDKIVDRVSVTAGATPVTVVVQYNVLSRITPNIDDELESGGGLLCVLYTSTAGPSKGTLGYGGFAVARVPGVADNDRHISAQHMFVVEPNSTYEMYLGTLLLSPYYKFQVVGEQGKQGYGSYYLPPLFSGSLSTIFPAFSTVAELDSSAVTSKNYFPGSAFSSMIVTTY